MSRQEILRSVGSVLVSREDGVAVVMALMAMLVMAAIGTALVFSTSTETLIASNFKTAVEGIYAADAAFELALADLPAVPDWNRLLDGSTRSSFTDGAPVGTRILADGTTLDLAQVVNLANCARTTSCTPAEMYAITQQRPWGANNPRWRLYGYGRLADILPTGSLTSPFYLIVMVADDSAENDGDPLHDGSVGVNPGAGILALRMEVFGGRGAHHVIEARVAPTAESATLGAVRVLSWRALR